MGRGGSKRIAVVVTWALCGLAPVGAAHAAVVSETFLPGGGNQELQIPAGVTHVQVTAVGGHGQKGWDEETNPRAGGPGGRGAKVTATVPVLAGTLYISFLGGGKGAKGSMLEAPPPGLPCYPVACNTPGYEGGDGGGASAVSSSPGGGAARLIVAGGGGGGGLGYRDETSVGATYAQGGAGGDAGPNPSDGTAGFERETELVEGGDEEIIGEETSPPIFVSSGGKAGSEASPGAGGKGHGHCPGGAGAADGSGGSATYENLPASNGLVAHCGGGGGGGGGYNGGGAGEGGGVYQPGGGGGAGASYVAPAATGSVATAENEPQEVVISYTVLAPSVSIAAPADGANYSQGQVVEASYSCEDGEGGSGIAECTGTVADGQPVDTSTPGEHAFTVTATSKDGQSSSQTVHYTVAPSTTCSHAFGSGRYVNTGESNRFRLIDNVSTNLAEPQTLVVYKNGNVLYRLLKLESATCTGSAGARVFAGEASARHAGKKGYRLLFTITETGGGYRYEAVLSKAGSSIFDEEGLLRPLSRSSGASQTIE
jgi:hypothetical protein